MASLSLRHIYKIYQGDVTAVKDFNLEIEDKNRIVKLYFLSIDNSFLWLYTTLTT